MSCKEYKLSLKKWDIISVDFGTSTSLIKEATFKKDDLLEICGVNIRYEFSMLHMAVVITPSFLNKANKVLVIPITSFNPLKHKEGYINHFVMRKRYYKSLKNDSVMLLDEMRSIDASRIIKKHNFHLKDSHKKLIKEKLKRIFIE